MSRITQFFLSRLLTIKQHVVSNGWVVNFSKRFPRLYELISARFSLSNFFGLPFTILCLLFISNLSVLIELGEDFRHSPKIEWFDSAVANFTARLRFKALDKLFYGFTFIASTISVIIISSCVTIILWFKKKYVLIVGLLIAVVGAGMSSTLGKRYYERARPKENAYYIENTFAFPSGHATLTIALYGFLFYAIFWHTAYIRKKANWWIAIIIFILAMGFSRIYLGVHYFSDVIAGYCLGLLWLCIAVIVVEYRNVGKRKII